MTRFIKRIAKDVLEETEEKYTYKENNEVQESKKIKLICFKQ